MILSAVEEGVRVDAAPPRPLVRVEGRAHGRQRSGGGGGVQY